MITKPSQLFQVHFQPTPNGKLVLGTAARIIPKILQQLQLQCLNKAAPELGKDKEMDSLNTGYTWIPFMVQLARWGFPLKVTDRDNKVLPTAGYFF